MRKNPTTFLNEDNILVRKCYRCKEIKTLCLYNFRRDNAASYKFAYLCKDCNKKDSKKVKEYNKKYHDENIEKIKKQGKEYRELNKDKLKAQRVAESDWKKEYNKKYRSKLENKERRNEKDRERRKNDPIFRRQDSIRKSIRKQRKRENLTKGGRTFQELGYTPKELNVHLDQWIDKPCEGGCGLIITHDNETIDHIIPSITAKNKEDVIRLNQLNNLRLLCGPCNYSKHCKIENGDR